MMWGVVMCVCVCVCVCVVCTGVCAHRQSGRCACSPVGHWSWRTALFIHSLIHFSFTHTDFNQNPHTHTLPHTFTYIHTLTRTTLTPTYTHTHIHTLPHTHSHTFTHYHTHIPTLPHPPTHLHTFTYTHSHTILTHIHTPDHDSVSSSSILSLHNTTQKRWLGITANAHLQQKAPPHGLQTKHQSPVSTTNQPPPYILILILSNILLHNFSLVRLCWLSSSSSSLYVKTIHSFIHSSNLVWCWLFFFFFLT